MGELFNRLSRKANIEFHSILFGVITMLNALYARSIGVKLVGKVSFRGWTSFFRAANSDIQIGKNCVFNSSGYTNHIGLNHRCIITTMDKNARIMIGDGTGMSSTTITSWKSIMIGENVRIGANCIIMDGDFHLDDYRIGLPRAIIVERNVWLGANVVVMKGVCIGENSIIGSNSIVTKDIPANCIAAGNPCRVIKQIL